MPITSSEDVLAFLEGMTERRLFKTHLPKDLLPHQVWDKKAKVKCTERTCYVSNMKNNKLTVFYINRKIIFEVADEGDRLTAYCGYLYLSRFRKVTAYIYDKYSLSRRARYIFIKRTY
jgi:hypothetical protein